MILRATKQQREYAKANGLKIIAVEVPGMQFVGPVRPEVAKRLLEWITDNVFKANAKAAEAARGEGAESKQAQKGTE